MKNYMTDIETMSRAPNGAIVSIGAVLFNEEVIVDEFHVPITLKSCTDLGLHIDNDTARWWSEQAPEVRASWDNDQAVSIQEALQMWSVWMDIHSKPAERIMWANGPDFDLVMLKFACNAVGRPVPWEYWNARCHRTMKNFFPQSFKRVGTHHSALDDAKNQALQLMAIVNARGFLLE